MATSAETSASWVQHVRRWLVNAAFLLGLTLALSIIGRLIFGSEGLGNSAALIAFVWYLTTLWFLPGAVLYLVLLELVPTGWSGRARRIAALVLSPLMGGVFWIYIVPGSESPLISVALVLASTTVYGAIVRLRLSSRPVG